jgi:hypothetical protein
VDGIRDNDRCDSRSPGVVENRLRGFHQGLKEVGYIEGECATHLAAGSHTNSQGDVDALVTIDGAMELTELARAGRRLMGTAQTINLGADIFLADTTREVR